MELFALNFLLCSWLGLVWFSKADFCPKIFALKDLYLFTHLG